MSTTKQAAKAKARIKLLEAGDPLFQVVYFLQEDQIAAELDALHTEMHRRHRSELTTFALCSAVLEQNFKVRSIANDLLKRGMLLFAFAGSSALQGGAA
jgi:hypothetical protein